MSSGVCPLTRREEVKAVPKLILDMRDQGGATSKLLGWPVKDIWQIVVKGVKKAVVVMFHVGHVYITERNVIFPILHYPKLKLPMHTSTYTNPWTRYKLFQTLTRALED
jgi:hypothetical protein